LLPSADEATTDQLILVDALVNIQVWAGAKWAVNKAAETASRILKVFMGRWTNLFHSTILLNHCQAGFSLMTCRPAAWAWSLTDLVFGCVQRRADRGRVAEVT
jgi:hypothetical protein